MTQRDRTCLRLAIFFLLLAGLAGYVMWMSTW